MRKKKLIKEIDGIVSRNNELYSKCHELEDSVNAKDTLIDSLKLQIEELKAENEILRSDYYSKKSVIVEDDDTTLDNGDIAVDETNDLYSQSANVPVSADSGKIIKESFEFKPILNETVLKICSSTIGRVVLKSADICNTFASENNINSKDLINLALGRTEVFKAEVLELATQEISEELLSAELNLKETEIIEYFELLLKQ